VLKAAIMGAEVVGAAYPCKNNWEFYGCVPNTEDGMFKGKEIGTVRLLDMWCIPGGFLIYSKKAFERARPKLKEYEAPETKEKILEAFRCNIEDNGYRIGEDVYFQQRYKEAGGIVWLEPDATIQHYGVKAWQGNYHQYLLGEKETELKLGATPGETEAMLESIAKNLAKLKAKKAAVAPVETAVPA
jgi:hypothetical protein